MKTPTFRAFITKLVKRKDEIAVRNKPKLYYPSTNVGNEKQTEDTTIYIDRKILGFVSLIPT